MPRVSVVVACYNGQPYLPAAMESILDQTFRDWEMIVVDDGSTDSSLDYLKSLAERDSRVILVEQTNQGQNAAANVAINMASAPLIARMDADDIAQPDRLAKQVAYMDTHPEVGLLGGQIRRLGRDRAGLESNFPTSHAEIVESLLKNHHAVCNPTIVFRKELFQQIGGYWQYNIAEDWDMFLRMSEVSKLANLDSVLLSYRFHTSSINGRRIVEAQLFNEYAAFLYQQRSQNENESTYEEFLSTHRSNRWPMSMLFVADSHSIGQYRKAIAEIYGGRTLVGSMRLALSIAMSPQRTVRRLVNMARRKARSTGNATIEAHDDSAQAGSAIDSNSEMDPPKDPARESAAATVDA